MIEDIYELSPTQQGMFFQSFLQTTSGINEEQFHCEVQGIVPLLLSQAWQHIIERHPVLRTSFHLKELDKPLQIVHRNVTATSILLDWRHLPTAEQKEQLSKYLAEDRAGGFELNKPSLIRLTLIQLGDQRYRFIVSFSHLVLDGWSAAQIFTELFFVYECLLADQPITLPASRAYGSYIAWLQQQDEAQAAAFWRAKLADVSMPPVFTAVPKSKQQTNETEAYGRFETLLDSTKTAALLHLAKQNHLTLNLVAQGAWALLLSCYTNRKNVIFGTTVSGRSIELTGIDAMVGSFINTLPVQVRISPEMAVIDWLQALRKWQMETHQFEHNTLAQIQEWSGQPAGLTLFENILVFENYPLEMAKKTGTKVHLRDNQTFGAHTHYTLTLLVAPAAELSLKVAYNKQFFQHQTIELILNDLKNVLTAMVDCAIQSPESTQQLIGNINDKTVQILQLQLVTQTARNNVQDAYLYPPRTLTEQKLTEIWAKFFHLNRISIKTNFFQLGGHSLMATQLVSRIREIFQIELAILTLFEYPTIELLARYIDQSKNENSMPPLRALPDRGDVLPLSFAQQRLWFLHQLEPNKPFYNIPVIVRITGQIKEKILEQSLREIVKRHETLRTTFSFKSGESCQIIHSDKTITLFFSDLRYFSESDPETEAEQRIRQEISRPFNLLEDLPIRAGLLRLDDYEYLMVMVLHHIAADAWSLNILFREMAELYNAFSQGEESPLPPLSIQYGDFVLWQRQYLQDDVLQSHINYWQNHLRGVPALLELTTDYPRQSQQTFRGAEFSIMALVSSMDKFYQRCYQLEVTLFMWLLAAFYLLLSYDSGKEVIVIGTDVANRLHSSTENLIGFFVNQLALRLCSNDEMPFEVLVQQTREVALAAYTHQDLPFNQLVEVINPVRHLGYTPLFQVKLVLQNAPGEPILAPEHHLALVDFDLGVSQLDINLRITEIEDGLQFSAQYNTDLFKVSTIARLLDQYQFILESVIDQPDMTVGFVKQLLYEKDKQRFKEANLLKLRGKRRN